MATTPVTLLQVPFVDLRAQYVVYLVRISALRMKLAKSVQQHILNNHTWTRNAQRIIDI